MKTARELMEQPYRMGPEVTVEQLARVLLEQQLDGVCVVDDEDRLIGVVTSMDLIYQEKRIHLPTFFMLFDSVLPLSGSRRTLEELEKVAGATVAQVMTHDPVEVAPDTRLDTIASLMVEKHLTIIPVTENRRLLGVVRKPAMLREAFGLSG